MAQKNEVWNTITGVLNIFLSLNSRGESPSFKPNLPWPPAVWVWVLASWTTTEGAAPEGSEGAEPAGPRPRSACMPGGRVTSSEAESMSFFRAVLISLSARCSEACTDVSVSDWGEVIPTDKSNNFSLFRAKKTQKNPVAPSNPWKYLQLYRFLLLQK